MIKRKRRKKKQRPFRDHTDVRPLLGYHYYALTGTDGLIEKKIIIFFLFTGRRVPHVSAIVLRGTFWGLTLWIVWTRSTGTLLLNTRCHLYRPFSFAVPHQFMCKTRDRLGLQASACYVLTTCGYWTTHK